MELYKRFSYKPHSHNWFEVNLDELISNQLNEKIEKWVKEMKVKHKNFHYRVLNADTFLDPRVKTDPGLESATAIIHILYEID